MLCKVEDFLKQINENNIDRSSIIELINRYLIGRTPETFDIDPSNFSFNPSDLKRDGLGGYIEMNPKENYIRTLILTTEMYNERMNDPDSTSMYVELHELYRKLIN